MHSTPFPQVSLGDVLKLNIDAVPVDPSMEYPMSGVYSFGKGLIQRGPLAGSKTTYKFLHRLHLNDFVISQPKGWEGALARVTEEFDGKFLSPVFPTFRPIDDKLEIKYLEWYCKQSKVWKNLLKVSRGIGARRETLYPEHFLELKIPLPSFIEQQRIVARIEEFASKIEEAKALKRVAIEERNAMLSSQSDVVFREPSWPKMGIKEFCEQPQYGYTESATYDPVGPKFLRITDIQNGTVNWETVPYCFCPQPEKYLLRREDILFARTGGTIGKSFLIEDCPDAVFASYLIRLRVGELVESEYLYQYFQTPSYWSQINEGKKGTGQPNLNGTKLSNIQVPIPPLEEQRRIVAHLKNLKSKADAVAQLQSESQLELDALLPSVLDKAFKGEL